MTGTKNVLVSRVKKKGEKSKEHALGEHVHRPGITHST